MQVIGKKIKISEQDWLNVNEAIGINSMVKAYKHGWVCVGVGSCCKVFRKGNIVIKFRVHCYDNFCKSGFVRSQDYLDSLPKKYLKYIAPVFFISSRKMIQYFVDTKERFLPKDMIKEIIRVSKLLQLDDDVEVYKNGNKGKQFLWNVGFIKGKIVFYDFTHNNKDYRRNIAPMLLRLKKAAGK